MLFDSHCHAWERWPYAPDLPDQAQRGSIDSLLYEMDSSEVERAAVVCARIGTDLGPACDNDRNNDYVARAVARHPDRLVMVGDVDGLWLTEHHTSGAADRLREATERYGLTAFTHYVADTNDGWFRSDDGREFFATAAELDLVVSLAITPAWQPDLRSIALANPSLPILVHHQGDLRPQRASFAADLAAVVTNADLPNVVLKVSGFPRMSERPWDFPFADAQTKVLRPLIAAFGSHRLVWGSDWPFARRSLTYRQTLEVVRSGNHGMALEELNQVLGGNMDRLLHTRRPAATVD